MSPSPDLAAEIDGLVEKHRHDQRAWQHQLDEAMQAEVRALGLLDAAIAQQGRARAAIRADVDEIDRLLDERRRLIPDQRKGQ